MAYPYIVVRRLASVYQWFDVPPGVPLAQLSRQVRACAVLSERRCCLVLGKGRCLYVEPDGTVKPFGQPPQGGFQSYHCAKTWEEEVGRYGRPA